MPTERKKTVYRAAESMRLDHFLVEQFEGISRAYLQELIQKNLVQVNGASSRKGQMLSIGDEIVVEPFERPEERTIEPNSDLSLKVVWQSSHVIVVDKPAGMPTHPNDFGDRTTLANAALARFPSIQGVGDDPLRPGIVHRLDSDTSGLLFLARNQPAFVALRELFDERKVEKKYLALVLGEIFEEGKVDNPIAHHATNPRRMVAVTDGANYRSRVREAVTLYRPMERFRDYTLLEVQTKTGRMHQVRIHLGSAGHPLAGDRLYQTPNQRQADRLGLQRHFLHATFLRAPLPPDNQLKSFDSSLPPELREVCEQLRQNRKLFCDPPEKIS